MKWNTNNCYIEAVNLKDVIKNPNIVDNIISLYADYETVKSNFDFFLNVIDIMMINGYNIINVDSYETLKYINDNLKDYRDLYINILDDYKNKDRSYIDSSLIDKVKFSLPLSYVMWDISFRDKLLVNLVSYCNNALSYNGNEVIDIDTLKKVKDLVNELNNIGKFNDLQKIILVSNYIEGNTQYLASNIDLEGEYESYVINKIDNIEDKAGLVENVLFNHYGLCTGIANSTMLLLNNPVFNIDARTICNNEHSLNIVKLDDKYYFLDNTWNITRSDKEFSNAIKPVRFNSKYILFGKDLFDMTVSHKCLCDNPHINEATKKGIKNKVLIKDKNKMGSRVSFEYNDKNIIPVTKVEKR